MNLEIVIFDPKITKDGKNKWIWDKSSDKAYILTNEFERKLLKGSVIPLTTSDKPRKVWAKENFVTLVWREPDKKETKEIKKLAVTEESPDEISIRTEDVLKCEKCTFEIPTEVEKCKEPSEEETAEEVISGLEEETEEPEKENINSDSKATVKIK